MYHTDKTNHYLDPSLLQRLASVSHFQGLPRRQIEAILEAGTILSFPPHSIIFQEGEECAGLYVLLNGKVHLKKHSAEGQEYILSVIEPVIMFNEVAALDGKQNPISAIAAQKTILWRASPEKLNTLLMEIPQVALGLLKVLAMRNRMLISKIEDISMRSILERTAKILLEISANGKRNISRLEHPNQTLAARVATVPEAFSRALRCFKDQKLIATTRTEIIILDPLRLAEVSGIPCSLQ